MCSLSCDRNDKFLLPYQSQNSNNLFTAEFWSHCTQTKNFDAIIITIHMPERTSKILLVRLTANKKALLFQIRVTCFARYTVWFGVTRCDQNAVNDYFTLSTITYFDWFPLHTRMEASFRIILNHGVYQNSLLVSTFLSNYAQWSHSAISDDTVHHNPQWTRCTFWLEYCSLSFYRKYTLHLMINSTFAAYVS